MRNSTVIFCCCFIFVCNAIGQPAVPGSREVKETFESLPRILVIGDSVSLAYTETVTRLLEGKARVVHNPGSAGDTEFGLQHLESWIGQGDWDVIYVNWGLNDIYVHDPVADPKGEWKEEGGINTLSMEYEDRLREIASILKSQQTTLIWATTTPVPPNSMDILLDYWGGSKPIPEGYPRWFPQHLESYNRIAVRIMREYGIYIHDLNAEISPLQGQFQKPGSPYFTEQGNKLLGEMVSNYIWDLIKPSLQIEFSSDVVTILDTDIGPWLDIDDWFDVLMYSMSELNHGGIIMEHYASDWEEAALTKFLGMIKKEDIPFARGLQQSLIRSEDGTIQSHQYEDGAEMILELMRTSDMPVRIICVGALSNVALAYYKNPGLFKRKIESVWFCGGMLNGYEDAHSAGRWDTNIHRDQVAADIIYNNDIPLVWFPVSLEIVLKSTPEQEETLKNIDDPALIWLYEGIDYWHKRRGKTWERQTQQEPGQGRRLWSMAVHAALNGKSDWIGYERGSACFNVKDWSTFVEDPEGPDLLLVRRDEKKITEWYKDFIVDHFR
ncbi:nucleoside hydrolase [Bacteroidota bacterium]